MASNSARRLVQRSTVASGRAFLSRNIRTQPSVASNSAPASRLCCPRRPLFSSFRPPVELGCGESLIPLHSATASSLLKSLLSSKVGQWASLSEGFATPL